MTAVPSAAPSKAPAPEMIPWGRVRRPRRVADRAMKIVCALFTAWACSCSAGSSGCSPGKG
jgi:hypothetical protein